VTQQLLHKTAMLNLAMYKAKLEHVRQIYLLKHLLEKQQAINEQLRSIERKLP